MLWTTGPRHYGNLLQNFSNVLICLFDTQPIFISSWHIWSEYRKCQIQLCLQWETFKGWFDCKPLRQEYILNILISDAQRMDQCQMDALWSKHLIHVVPNPNVTFNHQQASPLEWEQGPIWVDLLVLFLNFKTIYVYPWVS